MERRQSWCVSVADAILWARQKSWCSSIVKVSMPRHEVPVLIDFFFTIVCSGYECMNVVWMYVMYVMYVWMYCMSVCHVRRMYIHVHWVEGNYTNALQCAYSLIFVGSKCSNVVSSTCTHVHVKLKKILSSIYFFYCMCVHGSYLRARNVPRII